MEFVVAAGETVGWGHLSRCRALAAALRAHSIRTTVSPAPGTDPALLTYGFDGGELSNKSPSCVVVDVPRSEHARRSSRHVVIHDGPPGPVDADLVVNPNLVVDAHGYELPNGGRVAAGAQFALVGEDVRFAREQYPVPSAKAERILITCGAADPARVSEFAVEALSPLSGDLEIVLLIGPMNPRLQSIERAAAAEGIETRHGDSVASIAVNCDVAVTTLGVTATELACLGVPNVAVAHSGVQLPYLESYEANGIIRGVGCITGIVPADLRRAVSEVAQSHDERIQQHEAGRSFVDGLGASRVAREIVELIDR